MAGLGLLTVAGIQRAHAADGPKTDLTPDQALEKLRAGNQRYVNDPEVCTSELAQRRGETAGNQAPWATVLGCADSRVPPELLFGGARARRAVRRAQRRQPGRHGDRRHDRVWCRGPGLARGRGPGAHALRGRRRRLQGRDRPCDLPRCDRADDRADPAGGDRGARPARRLRRQRRPRQCPPHGPAPDRREHAARRLRASGKLKVVAGRYALDTGAVEFFDYGASLSRSP